MKLWKRKGDQGREARGIQEWTSTLGTSRLMQENTAAEEAAIAAVVAPPPAVTMRTGHPKVLTGLSLKKAGQAGVNTVPTLGARETGLLPMFYQEAQRDSQVIKIFQNLSEITPSSIHLDINSNNQRGRQMEESRKMNRITRKRCLWKNTRTTKIRSQPPSKKCPNSKIMARARHPYPKASAVGD